VAYLNLFRFRVAYDTPTALWFSAFTRGPGDEGWRCMTELPDEPDPARSRRLERVAANLLGAVRRKDGRETPVGPRAMRTRKKLLGVAEGLFARDGYANVSLGDIAQQSGVSLGTVYQYFADRDDIVATLAGESALRMLNLGADNWNAATGRLGLRRAVSAIVTIHWENRDFFSLWETASHSDARLGELRREWVGSFRRSFARSLARGMKSGHVRSGLDPEETARAMSLMVSAYCYDAFVADPPEPPLDPEGVIDHLTTLWAEAIGLREDRELRPGDG
jgi:AcrR family transcriptional regulator